MTVLLLSPVSRVINHYRPPLALMYLSGFLKKNGISAKIIDITLKSQIRNEKFYTNLDNYLKEIENSVIEEVLKYKFDIIGITCYTPEYKEVVRLSQKIKALKPQTKIIVGGIHPTLYPEDFISVSSIFDFIVIGEGERTLLELVQAIRSGKDQYNTVKGIGYFDKLMSKMIVTEAREPEKNLDDIAYPDYSDLDMDFYTTASPYSIRGVFTRSFYLSSSRGCPSSCTFCVAKKLREFHGIKKSVRIRSAKSLFNEVKHLRKYFKIDSFYFIDDLFTLNKKNVHEFSNLMRTSNTHLVWGCSSKVSTVDYETLKVMRDAGCIQIDFGVEKGSNQALKQLKKGITMKQVKKAFKHCDELGIRTFANALVNTPGETEQDLKDIIEFVEDCRPNIVSFNIFTPYPGCEIYDQFCNRFSKDEYHLLMKNPNDLINRYPDKFRFALHDVDFNTWVPKVTRKYNKIFPNLSIYFDPDYLRSIISSKRKLDYFKQFGSLVQEFIAQKF